LTVLYVVIIMSTRLADVAQRALSAISSLQHHDADDFVSGVTRTFRAGPSRRGRTRRPSGMTNLVNSMYVNRSVYLVQFQNFLTRILRPAPYAKANNVILNFHSYSKPNTNHA